MNDISEAVEILSPKKRELLEILQQEKQSQASYQPQRISRRPQSDQVPLSFAQQRLWLLGQLTSDSTYNIPFVRRLKGDLDQTALERSLAEIVRRHEVLRTIFVMEGKQIVGRALPADRFKMLFTDLMPLPDSEREAEARAITKKELSYAFKLSQEILIRVHLIKLKRDEHVVALNMHHIVSDGWSLGIFLQELSSLYHTFLKGESSSLPEIPIQYADYAYWQRERLQGSALESQLAYWREQLSGAPHLLELQADRPRSAVQTARGATQSYCLEADLTEELKAFSRREGVTLFITTLAAFQALLYKYTGQSDIVVGAPVANRNLPETEGVIGLFVNTLALRARLHADLTFRDFLLQARDVALGAYAHQDLPFEKLVSEMRVDRHQSHTPLFQVMFTLQNVPLTNLELAHVTIDSFESANENSMFDLTLTLTERPDAARGEGAQLQAYLEYSTDLFEGETIDRLFRHYVTILKSVVVHPEQKLAELPLLSDEERRRILVDWNDTLTSYQRDACFQELFERQVRRTPHAAALICGDERLTYAELNARSNQIGHYLISLGVGPEATVGVCMTPCVDLIAAILGVLKAGGAYVPLDPAYPRERLEFILKDAKIAALLTQQSLVNKLPADGVSLIPIDELRALIANLSAQNPERKMHAQNLAYIVFTSGTAGAPKGVLITHRSLVNHNLAMVEKYRLNERDRVLQFASISFDVMVEELFPTWLAGATVVIRQDLRATSINNFTKLVDGEKITILNLPAAFYHSWMNVLSTSGEIPPSLRLLIVGSERVSVDKFVTWLNMTGNRIPIINAYGPSETTVTTTTYTPLQIDKLKWQVPVGRPVSNTQVYLLDERLHPAPIGVPGELYIGGDGLARGYLNRPDLSAEKFIPNPFALSPGERFYRTGDRARYSQDGNIEILGRVDRQVKLRGFRIELSEIEAALESQDQVKEATVIIWDKEGTERERLVAYVACEQGYNLTPTELNNFLKRKLPAHMIPASFIILDKLPRLHNGKTDYESLPASERRSQEMDSAYVAPRTEMEKVIYGVWWEALMVEKIGVNDNFFDLGGHSLLMSEVLGKLQSRISKPLALVELFEYPTISSLAGFLDGDHGANSSSQQNQKQIEKSKAGKNRLRQQFKQRQQTANRK